MNNVTPLFQTREHLIQKALENANAEKLVLVYVNEYGQLECLASDDVTILEGVGMLETAKAGFIISSYENEP